MYTNLPLEPSLTAACPWVDLIKGEESGEGGGALLEAGYPPLLENSHKPYTQYIEHMHDESVQIGTFLLLFKTNYSQLRAPHRRRHIVLKERGTSRYH